MVTIDSVIPWKELQGQVRHVPLLHKRNGKTIYPYADATITLKTVDFDEVRTTSLYVARNLLVIQEAIAADIAPEGYEPLSLGCGLTLRSTNDDGRSVLTGFIPPIVEVDDEYGAYLLDGSHRANIGRWAGLKSFNAIWITGIRKDCPAYAYPNEWDEVVAYDVPPTQPELRKRYKQQNLYELFRDFGALNNSKPRYDS